MKNGRLGPVVLRALFVLSCVGASALLSAQEKFPSRPIEVILPGAPGGGSDASMRLLAEIVEPALGQRIIINNQPRGAFVPAFQNVKNAKPDGYTLGVFAFGQLTIQPHTIAAFTFTPDDYTPIAIYSAGPAIFCVRSDFPAKTGQELIEQLRANPDKYTYGTDGVGNNIRIAGERIFGKLGVTARPIPFSGAGETAKSFLGGHIDIYGGTPQTIMAHVQAGTARCPLVASAAAIPTLAQSTDLSQLGIPETETMIWRGIFGPKGMNPERVAFLEKVFMDAARSEKFRAYLDKNGEVAMILNATDTKKRVDKDFAEIGEIIRDLGLPKN